MSSENHSIVFITPSLGAGGIERIVSTLSNYYSRNIGLDIKIICFVKKKVFYQLDKSIEIYSLSDPKIKWFGLISKLFELRKVLRRINPKAMISFGSMYNSFFLISSLGLRGKKFVSDRSNPWRNSRLRLIRGGDERHDGVHHYFLKQILYMTATKILAQTKLSVDIERRNFGHDKVLYFPNPISTAPKTSAARSKIILNVGRFIPSKRQKELLTVFSELPKDYRSEWRLTFLGGGDKYFQEAKKLAASLGISEQVDFLGFVNNVYEWYQKAEIFAFVSSSEGFPNALAEAMAYGCACISYDCVAGPADLISNEKNGLLIPVNDRINFKKGLNRLLFDTRFRHLLQDNAKQVTEIFKIGDIAQILLDEIYKD